MDAQSEYLVVIGAMGDGSSDYGRRFQSIRCNRKEVAEKVAEWVESRGNDADAQVFHDPPLIGQE